jgi:hypothetical protein
MKVFKPLNPIYESYAADMVEFGTEIEVEVDCDLIEEYQMMLLKAMKKQYVQDTKSDSLEDSASYAIADQSATPAQKYATPQPPSTQKVADSASYPAPSVPAAQPEPAKEQYFATGSPNIDLHVKDFSKMYQEQKCLELEKKLKEKNGG